VMLAIGSAMGIDTQSRCPLANIAELYRAMNQLKPSSYESATSSGEDTTWRSRFIYVDCARMNAH